MADKEQVEGGKRLAEVYSPCLSLILQLRASSDYTDAERLRSNLMEVFNECERDAQRVSSSQDVDDAKFALVAFVDETILSSGWTMKGQWMARPLQLQLYNRFDAGEQFFERLEAILRGAEARIQVLEVYYLCLTLGFKGRYQIVEQDKLRALIEKAHAVLKQSPQMKSGVLSPNGLPRDQVATEVRSKLPTWAIVAAAVTIGILIYIVLRVGLESRAREVRDNLDQLARVESARSAESARNAESARTEGRGRRPVEADIQTRSVNA